MTGNSPGAVGVLCTAQFVVVLDVTIVTSALPALGRDLGFAAADLHWVVSAYTLVFAGLLIVGGRIADAVGARRVFGAGLAGFTAASLGCGLAWSAASLIGFRIVQAAGAALLSPAALALLTAVSPQEGDRRRVVGMWTAAAAAGGASGWVIGGLLTQYAGWRWVFCVNVPIGVVALALVPAVVAHVAARRPSRLDLVGAAGITLGLAAVVLGLTRLAEGRGGALDVLAPLVVGGAVLTAVLRHERRTDDPLLPLALLRSRHLAAADLVAVAVTASTSPAMLLAVLYVQDVLGRSPAEGALLFPALNLTVILGSLLAPRALRRIGARATGAAGMTVIGLGVAPLVAVPQRPDGAQVAISAALLTSFALMGTGLGLASVASTTAGTSAVVEDDRGVASGVLASAAQLGTALGLAVLVPMAAGDHLRVGFLGAVAVALLGALAATLLPRRDHYATGVVDPDEAMAFSDGDPVELGNSSAGDASPAPARPNPYASSSDGSPTSSTKPYAPTHERHAGKIPSRSPRLTWEQGDCTTGGPRRGRDKKRDKNLRRSGNHSNSRVIDCEQSRR